MGGPGVEYGEWTLLLFSHLCCNKPNQSPLAKEREERKTDRTVLIIDSLLRDRMNSHKLSVKRHIVDNIMAIKYYNLAFFCLTQHSQSENADCKRFKSFFYLFNLPKC